MKKSLIPDSNRRQFITKVVPACAITCMGGASALAMIPKGADLLQPGSAHMDLNTGSREILQQQGKHKFDQEYERKLTYRQVYGMQYRANIQLGMALIEEMGKEKAIDFLKKDTRKNLLRYGKMQAERSGGTKPFFDFTNNFRDLNRFKNTLSMEIVEDSEKAFELKVTECIWADTFMRARAGEIGYACVCWGDYAWAEGFNSKIEMVRDKTLMEGEKTCNHRYLWKG